MKTKLSIFLLLILGAISSFAADTKITDLDELSSLASGDLIPIVDVSDSTMAASGTTKKVQVGTIVSDTAFASSLNGKTTVAPSANVLYDWGHTFDTDDDGKVNVLDQGVGIAITDASGVLQTPVTTSALFASAISDETGTGVIVYGTGPSISGPDLIGTTTIGADPALSANHITIGTTGIIFEGTTADAFEGLLTVTDPTADRTWTLPNASGTILLDSNISDTAFASSWDSVTTIAPSKNAIYDWAHTFDTDDDGKVNVLDIGAGIPKTDSSGVVSVATAGTDYTTPSSTESPTNKTFDAGATGNVLKFKSYIYLKGFDNVTGALPQNTNDYTVASGTYMQAIFSNSADETANYMEWRIAVPDDIDTSVEPRGKLKFKLTGADTGTHRYVLSMASVADSAAYTGTVGTAINLDFAGDASGASGDVETVGYTTLTGWGAALTAGREWVVRLARDGNATQDGSTVDSGFGVLVIEYGATQ
jgi:hypothetical protein